MSEDPVIVVVVTGSYSWIGADGVEYSYRYVADQNGYRIENPIDQGPPQFIAPNTVLSLIG